MKWHMVRLQLRFEVPIDVQLNMLLRQATLASNISLYLLPFLV